MSEFSKYQKRMMKQYGKEVKSGDTISSQKNNKKKIDGFNYDMKKGKWGLT